MSLRLRYALFTALLVVPLLGVLALGFGQDPHAVPSMLEGHDAPPFVLKSLEGKTFDLQKLHGTPVVLNFWATWCYPCKAEHAALQAAARHYSTAVQFLGVVYQDSPETAKDYLRAQSSVFANLVDPHARMAIDYGVAGVPESYFISPQGRIVYKHAGVLDTALLQRILDPLVAQAEAMRKGGAPL